MNPSRLISKLYKKIYIRTNPAYPKVGETLRTSQATFELLETVSKRTSDLEARLDGLGSQVSETGNNINRAVEDVGGIVHGVSMKIENRPYLPPCGERLTKTSKRKVLIVGYFGDKNYGDELMLDVIWSRYKSLKNVEVSIILMNTLDYDLKQWEGARLFTPPSDLDQVANIATYYDELIIGGGAHIDDSSLKSWWFVPYLALELSLQMIAKGKKVKWVGVSSSAHLENKKYIDKLRKVINGADHFSLRDAQSRSTLQSAGIDTKQISEIDDIAFSADLSVRTIGVTLIDSFSDKAELLRLLKDIKNFVKQSDEALQIALLPFMNSGHSDQKLYDELITKIDWEGIHVFVAPEYRNTSSMLLAIKSCDILVNMRYHASLLGLNNGTPTVSVCYDNHPHYYNKVTHLHQTFGNDNLIYLSKYNDGDVTNMLNRIDLAPSAVSTITTRARRELDGILL